MARNITTNNKRVPKFTPLVSVIIPAYNRMHVINRAIESVIKQTFTNWELIIVDDASAQPLSSHFNFQDKRIKMIQHDVNLGAAASRNRGIKESRGKYIAFLDTDDEWFPEKLEKQVNFLETTEENIGGCVTACNLIYNKKVIVQYSPISNFYQQSLLGEHFSSGSTLMFKKSCLDWVGLQSTDLPRLEDWEWQIRFSKCYNWTVLPNVLANIYLSRNSNFEAVDKSISILERKIKCETYKEQAMLDATFHYERMLAGYFCKKIHWFLFYFIILGIRFPNYLMKRLLKIYKKTLK